MTKEAVCRPQSVNIEALAAVRPQLQPFVDRGELAGVVCLTAHAGEIVQQDAVGWSDIDTQTPMRSDTLFRIASMSKPITSVAALMLMEEGKISLSDPIAKWIPELANLKVMRDASGPLSDVTQAKRQITIEDLFTHRSGIAYAPFSEGPLKHAYEQALGDPGMNRLSVDAWLAALSTLPLAYQPGERFHYGHSTDVLGFLIGRIEGKPFRRVLQERIFSPLGMRDTDFWLAPDKRSRLASLYAYNADADRLVKVETDMYEAPPDYTPGGGGLISSAHDYYRFALMLLREGALDGVRLLRPETVRLMQTNRLTQAQRQFPFAGMRLWQKSGFGLGVSIAEDLVDNPYACGAAGAITWPGIFGTWWQVDPSNDLVMIYLIQHQVPVSANSGSTIATGRGAAGRRALPVYQRAIYGALENAMPGKVRTT